MYKQSDKDYKTTFQIDFEYKMSIVHLLESLTKTDNQ